MNERDVIDYLLNSGVSRETVERLSVFVAFLETQNRQQNLIAASTLAHVWHRHILDSVQLLPFAPDAGSWLDIGSGPGFPGLVIAAISSHRMTLVEERAKRVAFLSEAAKILAVDVIIEGCKLQRLTPRPFDVISARAFAPLAKLLALAYPFSGPRTVWILPKGQGAKDELDKARETWHGSFTLMPSITDPQARIIIARDVRPKESR